MAVGLIPAVAEDVWTGEVDLTTFAWIKLHIGDPGAAGTANPATETDRVQVSSYTPSGGTLTNAADLEWEDVAASETYSHFSAWTASTAGTCGFTGTITASAVTAGDNFRIAAGALDATLNVAA